MFNNEIHLDFTRALIRNVLEDSNREWTIQGFGFLRTYFGPTDKPKMYRLHLWDGRFTVPNVSTIHDHPWDLTSLIAAGNFCNQQYDVTDIASGPRPMIGPTHDFATIKTGVGGGIERDAVQYCKLIPCRPEYYMPGDVYGQRADEVHETKFEDGSVTINKRIGDTERARVFWPAGTPWVDAMPRAATPDEVKTAVGDSLERWF